MYVKPTGPRSIGGVLDDSIRLYRAAFVKVWLLGLAAQSLVAVPTFYSSVKFRGIVATNAQTAFSMYQSPSFWLPYIVCAIATIGLYNAVTLRLAETYQGESAPAGEALAAGYRRLPRVFLLYLSLSLCVFAVGIVAAIAARGVGPALLGGLAIAALPLFIFLFGRLYLAHAALIIDDLAIFKSIETSWALTRGHWWRGATIYTVILLIAMVFYFIIVFLVGLLTVSFGPRSVTGLALTQLISVAGVSLVLPLVSGSLVCIYFDFKLRVEGADLADRVKALATQ